MRPIALNAWIAWAGQAAGGVSGKVRSAHRTEPTGSIRAWPGSAVLACQTRGPRWLASATRLCLWGLGYSAVRPSGRSACGPVLFGSVLHVNGAGAIKR